MTPFVLSISPFYTTAKRNIILLQDQNGANIPYTLKPHIVPLVVVGSSTSKNVQNVLLRRGFNMRVRVEFQYNHHGNQACYELVGELIHTPQDIGDTFIVKTDDGKSHWINGTSSQFVKMDEL